MNFYCFVFLQKYLDLPVKTVVSAEVGKSAGSFAFAEIGLQNRFIIW